MTVRGIEAARAGTWKHLAFVSIMQSPVEGAIAALVIACHQIGTSRVQNQAFANAEETALVSVLRGEIFCVHQQVHVVILSRGLNH